MRWSKSRVEGQFLCYKRMDIDGPVPVPVPPLSANSDASTATFDDNLFAVKRVAAGIFYSILRHSLTNHQPMTTTQKQMQMEMKWAMENMKTLLLIRAAPLQHQSRQPQPPMTKKTTFCGRNALQSPLMDQSVTL